MVNVIIIVKIMVNSRNNLIEFNISVIHSNFNFIITNFITTTKESIAFNHQLIIKNYSKETKPKIHPFKKSFNEHHLNLNFIQNLFLLELIQVFLKLLFVRHLINY
jgi:hypothetical protein